MSAAYFPLCYWCSACGQLLFKSDAAASGLVETVCKNRRCPNRGPRIVQMPESAVDHAPACASAYRRSLKVAS